ncbi:VanZ family protein [Ectobacillus antri]|uniref:VanZ family protein n=1 Tax=Ectobacillus antri TaxID=2486280 RepID=A0ABT6H3V4_9BACI|nr:VanZ family protein [Ectobacillus antri]MDG4655343.1 VanZ family protein [Ectobacillus antri]MDG5753101.1 VanZ family protein [Ectobacillus antri]
MKLVSNKYIIILFCFYITLVLKFSFIGVGVSFPERLLGNYDDVSHNLIPFETIGTYLTNFHHYNFNTWFYNTFGNVLLFMPLGILLPLIFTKIGGIKQLILASFIGILTIEFVQYFTLLGVFDIDDIILNLLGVVLGFCILSQFTKFRKRIIIHKFR